MSAEMAMPVTPGASLESGLDRCYDNDPPGPVLTPSKVKTHDDGGSEKCFSLTTAKGEDVEMKEEPAICKGLDDQQLISLERALKNASTEEFKDVFYKYGKGMLVKFNGVSELLNDWCSLGLDSKQFAEDLLNMFPKSDAIAFASCLPGNDSDEFNLHLSDLSWFPSASTKPPPYLHTCLALWDEITTNGFVTKGDCAQSNDCFWVCLCCNDLSVCPCSR